MNRRFLSSAKPNNETQPKAETEKMFAKKIPRQS